MKQSVQQVKRKQTSAVNKKRPNVTHLRPRVVSQSNHTRLANDKWERQANDIAARVARGEINTAKQLTPARAASKKVPHSCGMPLPADVLNRFETAFGAELDGVRVHSDAAAHRANLEMHSEAFASGKHIYFSAGAFDPATEAGQRLLAHELAHVLQQTGRPGSSGLLRVTDIQGQGDVQCNYLPLLTDLHGQNDETREIIQEIGHRWFADEIILNRQTETIVRLEADILRGRLGNTPIAQVSDEVLAFVFDGLTIAGRYEGAAFLISERPGLMTFGAVVQFQEWLAEQDRYGPDWHMALFDTLPLLRRFWPDRAAYIIREGLFNPRRLLQRIPTFAQVYNQALRDAEDGSVLGYNERVILALRALQGIEDSLVSPARGKLHRFRRRASAFSPGRRELAFAGLVRQWGRSIIEANPGDNSALTTVRRQLGEMLRDLGQQALEFWTAASGGFDEWFAEALSITTATPGREERVAVLHRLPSHPMFTRFQSIVETQAPALLQLDRNNLPISPGRYASRRNRFLGQLTAFARDASTQISSTTRNGVDDAEFAQALARAWLWAELIIAKLSQYDAGRDAREARRYATADERVGHRIKVSRILFALSLQLGLDSLRELTARVSTNADPGISVVALMGEWNVEEPVSVEAMADDFNDVQSTFAETPVSLRQLIILFSAMHRQRLNDVIQAQLGRRENIRSGRQQDIIEQAEAQAGLVPQPQRWRIAGSAFAIHPSDRRLAGELVVAHPKTQALLQRELGDDPFTGYWLPRDRVDRVFIWLIPSIRPLVQRLREVDDLNAIVAAHGVDAQSADDLDWLYTLALTPADELQATLLVGAEISVFEQAQEARTPGLLRRVNTLRRRRLAPGLSQRLRAYANDDITNFGRPNAVLTAIGRYAAAVQPESDENAQVAALILQLAPAMREAFSREGWFGSVPEQRYDIITGFFEFLTIAERHLQGDPRLLLQQVVQPHADVQLNADETAAQLIANGADLRAVIDGFNTVRRRVQREFGFTSENGSTLKSLRYVPEISPGDVMEFESAEVQLVAINFGEGFSFHPAYGRGTGARLDPIILDTDGEPVARSGRVIVTIKIDGGADIPVRDNDYERLEYLTDVIEWHAFIESLRNLGETIERATALALDLLELVPGVGQAVTVARIIAEVSQFLIQDFPAIRDELLEDPGALVRELQDALEHAFTAEKIFEFLILTGPNPMERFRRNESPRQRPRRRRRGRLGRLINSVKSIGARVVTSVDRAKTAMRGPLLSAQGTIATRPALAFALERLPQMLSMIERVEASVRADVFSDLLENPQSLSGAISTMLEGLQELELPREVIPTELVVETVLVNFLNRFGAKGRLLRRAIEALGLLPEVADPIAAALRESRLDPNRIWTENFLPEFEQSFITARNDLVTALYELVNGAIEGLPGAPIARPSPSSLPAVAVSRTDFPESDLLRRSDSQPVDGRLPMPEFAGGQPLPTAVRKPAERRFGHDLGHVRVHRDSRAEQIADAAQAHALTSGSHIFLANHIQTSSTSGISVLNHELAHVLQQAGPRPFGRAFGTSPVAGSARKGVHYDRSREAAADRMVARGAANSSGEPIPVLSAGGDALVPSLRSVSLRVVRVLAQREFAEGFEGAVETATRLATNVPGDDEARALWTAVTGAIASASYANFLRDAEVKAGIVRLVTQGDRRRDIDRAIVGLASMSQQRRPGAERGAGAAVPATELQPRRFANLLETYVFAKTGVAMEISLRRDAPRLAARNPVRVRTIDLGKLHPSSPLGRLARRNTLQHRYRSGRINEREWREIRQRVANLGANPRLWDGGEFRLNESVIDDYQEFKRASSAVVVPEWSVYVNTNHQLNQDTPGLRVGTHGELKGLQSAVRQERRSHHIPQYLLVEYFRNEKTGQIDNDYLHLPGFQPQPPASPNQFQSDQGSIDMDALNSGARADGMPAILLAEDTHVRGNVHVGYQGLWNYDSNEMEGTRSQARTVHNEFYRRLKAGLDLPSTTPDGDVRTHARANEGEAKTAIYRAMTRTYHWMYEDVMKPALNDALRTREVAYYAGIAARVSQNLDSDGDLRPGFNPRAAGNLRRLSDVMTAVENKNTSIMGDWR